jgi:thiol-disulfide isomerase/thioredoxin
MSTKSKISATFTQFLLCLLIAVNLTSSILGQNVNIELNLRGVSESKISLLPLAGRKAYRPILDLPTVKSGDATVLYIPAEYLPGEFVLRFDYKEKPESTPYPCEKHIVVGRQSLTLWLNPMYCNSSDSSKFQPGELENAALRRFQSELGNRMQKIGLLQQFLMGYDEPQSAFYLQGIAEYERRRSEFNVWLDQQVDKDAALFVSSTYRFHYLPGISFTGSERDRLLNLIDGYFEGLDFNDPLIIRSAQMNEWMNAYVNLHGQMATSVALRDSLIPAAAYKAIEKAKTGHPQVYGWMVDYFYRGFESNNMPQGMKVLQPYLDDPACLTSKRMEIERRLKGMETLVPGIKAPEFTLSDDAGKEFTFSKYRPVAKNLLIIFWSADCAHCMEEINQLYPWQQQAGISDKLEVIAVSLDESATEVAAWERKIKELKGWKHLRAKEGINSQIANDYFILATPVMVLINGLTGEITALPPNHQQIGKYLQ